MINDFLEVIFLKMLFEKWSIDRFRMNTDVKSMISILWWILLLQPNFGSCLGIRLSPIYLFLFLILQTQNILKSALKFDILTFINNVSKTLTKIVNVILEKLINKLEQGIIIIIIKHQKNNQEVTPNKLHKRKEYILWS